MRQQRHVRATSGRIATATTPPRVAVTFRSGAYQTRGPVAGRPPGLPVLTACLPARNRAVASRGGPHRLNVAGAAAAYERESRLPRSRFARDDVLAHGPAYREFH